MTENDHFVENQQLNNEILADENTYRKIANWMLRTSQGEPSILLIGGMPGSQKNTLAAQIIAIYQKIFPDRPLPILSDIDAKAATLPPEQRQSSQKWDLLVTEVEGVIAEGGVSICTAPFGLAGAQRDSLVEGIDNSLRIWLEINPDDAIRAANLRARHRQHIDSARNAEQIIQEWNTKYSHQVPRSDHNPDNWLVLKTQFETNPTQTHATQIALALLDIIGQQQYT